MFFFNNLYRFTTQQAFSSIVLKTEPQFFSYVLKYTWSPKLQF